MLNLAEKKILEFLTGKLLVTKEEIRSFLAKQSMDNGDSSLGRLRDLGMVDKVESLGTCFVITQKGMRMLKEGKL